METTKPFSVALRDLLIEHDYATVSGKPSWAAFAAELDVHYETLRRAVAGERPPSPTLMEECARALRIRPEYFFEYRVYLAQRDFDPQVVGVERATQNLNAWASAREVGRQHRIRRQLGHHRQRLQGGRCRRLVQPVRLTTTTHNAFHNNDSHDIDPTQITTHLSVAHDACDTEDVRINDYGYGTDTYRGWYECHVFNSSQNCDEGHAHINTSYSTVPENYDETEEVVCEEIGHSVGLAHTSADSSCMSTSDSSHLDGHDKNVIDNHY